MKTILADINTDGRVNVIWNYLNDLTNEVYEGLAKVDQSNGGAYSFETATQVHPDGSVDWDSFEKPVMTDVNGDQKPDII